MRFMRDGVLGMFRLGFGFIFAGAQDLLWDLGRDCIAMELGICCYWDGISRGSGVCKSFWHYEMMIDFGHGQ